MQDGIFNRERTQRTGNISTSTFIYLHTYTSRAVKQSCTYVQARKQSRDGNKDTSKEKHNDRILLINPQTLIQFYLADGATTFIQKQRNGHSQRREWQTWSVDLYSAGPGRPNGSRETVAGYLPPWWSASRDVPSPRPQA